MTKIIPLILSMIILSGCFVVAEQTNNNDAQQLTPTNKGQNATPESSEVLKVDPEGPPAEAWIMYGEYLSPDTTKESWDEVQKLNTMAGYDTLSDYSCSGSKCRNVTATYTLTDPIFALNNGSIYLESIEVSGTDYLVDTFGCDYVVKPTKLVLHEYFCNVDLIGSEIDEIVIYPVE